MYDMQCIPYVNKLVDYLLPDGSPMEKYNLTSKVLDDANLRFSLIERHKENLNFLKDVLLHDMSFDVKLATLKLFPHNSKLLLEILESDEISSSFAYSFINSILQKVSVTEQILLNILKKDKHIIEHIGDPFNRENTIQDELKKIVLNEDFPRPLRLFALDYITDVKFCFDQAKALRHFDHLVKIPYKGNEDYHNDTIIHYYKTNDCGYHSYLEYILPLIANTPDVMNEIMHATLNEEHSYSSMMNLIDYGILNVIDNSCLKHYYKDLKKYQFLHHMFKNRLPLKKIKLRIYSNHRLTYEC